MRVKSRPPAPPFPRAARAIAAGILVALGLAAIRGGAAALPWVANLSALVGFPRGHGPRLFGGVLFALAAMLVLAPSWSRRVALVAAGAIVFAGVATLSAIRATRLPGPDGPGLSGPEALLVAGAALVALSVAVPLAIRAYRSSAPASRGLGAAWRIAAAFASLGAGLAIAAPRAASAVKSNPAGEESPRTVAPPPEVASIDLDVAAWQGRPIAETPIAGYLPDLAGLVGGDPVFLVLFNARCGTCHDLFRDRFAGALPRRVLAIEIPPAGDAVLAAGDGFEAIDCPACERLSLPAGPRWLVRPPTVVRIDGGVVTCIDDAGTGSCFPATP